MTHLVGFFIALTLVAVSGWDGQQCSKDKATAQAHHAHQISEAVNAKLTKLTDELQLTSAQVTKVRAVFDDCQHACSALTATFAPVMAEIRALKSAENPDYEAIKAKKMELKALKEQHASKLAAHRAGLVKKIKTVLTPDQVARFEQIESDVFGDDLTLVASMQ
jgi:Spy/CpxP family protein refolding chaperone